MSDDDESAFFALVFAVVVDHFVDRNLNGNWFWYMNGNVLLHWHWYRFLNWIGHVLLNGIGYRFLNWNGDGLDDGNCHGLGHVDVHGVGLRYRYSDRFRHRNWDCMWDWYSYVFVNGNWNGFLDFDGLGDDVSAVTVLLTASVASFVSAAVTAGVARIYRSEGDYQQQGGAHLIIKKYNKTKIFFFDNNHLQRPSWSGSVDKGGDERRM